MNFTTLFILNILAAFVGVEIAVWLEAWLAKKKRRPHEKNP